MLVSVSFSLKLVKMKVVTRLEMVVSTVTIHSAQLALGTAWFQAINSHHSVSHDPPGKGVTKLLFIDLPLFLPD